MLSQTHYSSQVDGDGQFTRVSGSSVGGGTFWGLCSLLTGKADFDEILALSATGNNANVSLVTMRACAGCRAACAAVLLCAAAPARRRLD